MVPDLATRHYQKYSRVPDLASTANFARVGGIILHGKLDSG